MDSWLRRWLSGIGRVIGSGRAAADRDMRGSLPPAQVRKNALLPLSEEERLVTYVRRIGVLDERPARAEPEMLAALARLFSSGKEAEALRLGGALASALLEDDEVQLLVAELLFRQRLTEAAQPLLLRVLELPNTASEKQLRARWLLAEIAIARGAQQKARAELVQILAEDWNYLGAKERLFALRGELEPSNPRSLTEGAATAWAATATLMGHSPDAPRYRLLRELGVGGSGAVYLAIDEELGCEVALKLFHRHDGAKLAASSAGHGLREGRLLSSLRHPGVLFLYDADVEGRYLAMELCEGGSLRTRLHSGPLPWPLALLRAVELSDTLRVVHGLGISHGDLKPENLLFRSPQRSARLLEADYGDLVLADFGIARRGQENDAGSSALAGTRRYLAPERLHGSPPSAAADLYSLGVILQEIFGEPVPLVVRPLLERLVSADPAARLSAALTHAELGQISVEPSR